MRIICTPNQGLKGGLTLILGPNFYPKLPKFRDDGSDEFDQNPSSDQGDMIDLLKDKKMNITLSLIIQFL